MGKAGSSFLSVLAPDSPAGPVPFTVPEQERSRAEQDNRGVCPQEAHSAGSKLQIEIKAVRAKFKVS